MDQSLQDRPRRPDLLSLGGVWRFLTHLYGTNARTVILAASAVAAVWVPPAILTALRGGNAFRSFLTDYASQSRFLVVLPVLILAVPNLNKRHALVAHHLRRFVPQNQVSRFEASQNSFERLRDSRVAHAMIVLLTYALAAWLVRQLSPDVGGGLSWLIGAGGYHWLSPAGTWSVFVSYPALVFFTLLWLWRQLLWTRFMRSTGRLDLSLIAAHPDRLAGLGVMEASLRGQVPFSFCMGIGMAGAVANRVFHHGEKLTAFGHYAGVLVGAVFLVCVAPYFVFTPVLMQIRRLGLLRYGAIAHTAGEQFEEKWLNQSGGGTHDLLAATDFEAMNNLYGVVANVNDIRVLPVGRVDIYFLFAAAFAPALPVIIGSIPLQTVARAAVRLVF